MHHDALPLSYVAGRSHLDEPAPTLAEAPAETATRRGWFAGLIGFAAGAGALATARGLSSSGSGPRPGPAGSAEREAPRGTVEWALQLLGRPAAEILEAAGDLERVSMQHRTEARLVPCFQRLLDVALEESVPYADEAGACAARSLGRMRRSDLLAAAAIRLGDRTDRVQTRGAVETWRARLEKGR